ncbi:MAG: coproporphyrinogen dehydrogenase HemZ [Lachnospiraceae bacterium]
MIEIRCKEDIYAYDMYHILKAFFPNMQMKQTVDFNQEVLVCVILEDGVQFSIPSDLVKLCDEKKDKKHFVNRAVYKWISEYSNRELSWGILTGIRPTKMMMKRLEEGQSEEEVCHWFEEEYFVSPKKAMLGLEIAKREQGLLSQLNYEEGYSLYVGIPFCPTRCSYCSFTSQPLSEWKDKVAEYMEALYREIDYVARVSKQKQLNTIYIGGGTPTTLTANQLDSLLTHLESSFSYEHLKEITVEAGRPDSITREKLEVLRTHKIHRISINPQTMQQKTLDIIGRKHTIEEVRETYILARDMGFSNINMDLIAGLPGEVLEDMRDTLEQIKALAPDSLTVHSLAMKRASKMGQERVSIESGSELSEMIDMAANYAKEMGLEPYYMYRQKNIAGNFENVGYAKVDKAGIYNILIMEEKQSILAVGAGASTKIVRPNDLKKKIVRVENVKDVADYIARVDEMIERKEEWLWH